MGRPSLRGSRGFTYIGLLIAVAIMGIMLSAAGTLWSIASKREKEVELIFIGHQVRSAIARYYAAGGFRYPRELADLVSDERSAVPRHFLRKIYRDPMTGQADWQIIRAADGGVMGIASSSKDKSMKRANFEPLEAGFKDMDCYCDWQFLYEPRRARARGNLGTAPSIGPGFSPTPGPGLLPAPNGNPSTPLN
jgi:type II secretory pathway pseudopilin PulG